MIVGKREYYINPIAGGTVSWRSVQSSDLGSEIAWEIGNMKDMKPTLEDALTSRESTRMVPR